MTSKHQLEALLLNLCFWNISCKGISVLQATGLAELLVVEERAVQAEQQAVLAFGNAGSWLGAKAAEEAPALSGATSPSYQF